LPPIVSRRGRLYLNAPDFQDQGRGEKAHTIWDVKPAQNKSIIQPDQIFKADNADQIRCNPCETVPPILVLKGFYHLKAQAFLAGRLVVSTSIWGIRSWWKAGTLAITSIPEGSSIAKGWGSVGTKRKYDGMASDYFATAVSWAAWSVSG
jgi:hypothetical protein